MRPDTSWFQLVHEHSGSDYFSAEHSVGEDAHQRAGELKTRFFVALPLGVIIMALSMVPAWQFPGWQWLVAALTLPVVTWAAWPFHVAAFRAARHGSTTMDTLVSMGVIASSLWSYWALFFGGAGMIGMKMSMSLIPRANHGHAELYFEAAAMIVVFLLGGRWAEALSRYRAGDALRSLLNLGAKTATIVTPDGETVIPAADLHPGDVFRVMPGEKVATDGVVLEGQSALDTALLTGESVPVDVGPGDAVTGATINTWGSLTVRATRVGADTTLAQIGRLVEEAQSTKAPVQRLADKVSAVFVPIVIVIALLTLVVWLLAGGGVQAAFTAAVAVLVVACPCALGLATPTALLVGSGRASQQGIIIRNAEVLEASQRIDVIALDKTGTITTGQLSVEGVIGEPETLLLAAAVEGHSEHPLAKAIAQAAPTELAADFSNHAGRGVSGIYEGQLVLVGRPAWLAEHGIALPSDLQEQEKQYEDSGATVVAVAKARVPGKQPELVGASVVPLDVPEGLVQVRLRVGGMTCASCVNRVERKLKKLPGVDAQVNLATETASVLLHDDHSDEELERAVKAAGYDAQVLSRDVLAATSSETPTGGRTLPDHLADGEIVGLIALRDTVKPTSVEAVRKMKQMGIELLLLSGDNRVAAEQVAKAVGIDRVVSGVLPEAKQKEIASLQQGGKRVGMVGDGVNDAAALAQADLGVAMGSGTDAAISVSDVTIVNSDLRGVPRALEIARKTLGTIKGNLFWAFFYNVAAIPVACLGLLNPMIAAAAMAMSSVFVVLNSLRLRRA